MRSHSRPGEPDGLFTMGLIPHPQLKAPEPADEENEIIVGSLKRWAGRYLLMRTSFQTAPACPTLFQAVSGRREPLLSPTEAVEVSKGPFLDSYPAAGHRPRRPPSTWLAAPWLATRAPVP